MGRGGGFGGSPDDDFCYSRFFVILDFWVCRIFWYSRFFDIRDFLVFKIFCYSIFFGILDFLYFQDYFGSRGGFNGLTDIDGKEEEKLLILDFVQES